MSEGSAEEDMYANTEGGGGGHFNKDVEIFDNVEEEEEDDGEINRDDLRANNL